MTLLASDGSGANRQVAIDTPEVIGTLQTDRVEMVAFRLVLIFQVVICKALDRMAILTSYRIEQHGLGMAGGAERIGRR